MASTVKPLSRTELKDDFEAASRIFRRDCLTYFDNPTQSSLEALNSAYDHLEVTYHVVCPQRDPLSALIHRIRQAVIRAWERLISFCDGDEEAVPPISSREIKREFEACGALHRFFNGFSERSPSSEALPPFFEEIPKSIQSRPLAAKSKTTTHPPAAPRTAAAPQNKLAPSLASQGIDAVGLENPSCNCWVISFFQIIAHTPPLREMYLNVARALQNGPNPEIEGNVENFNNLADRYVAFSEARKVFLEAKLTQRAKEQELHSSWNKQILQRIEDHLPGLCFVVPENWNPAPPPPSDADNSHSVIGHPCSVPAEPLIPFSIEESQALALEEKLEEEGIAKRIPPIATPAPLLSDEEIQKQTRKFKRILRKKIAEEQKNLPKQCQDACKKAKINETPQAIFQTCQASLQRAWNATCTDKKTPHLSQELIDLHVKPHALRYERKVSGSEETETKRVYAETLTEIFSTLYPKDKDSALTSQEQQIHSLLAANREEAIAIARDYGVALEYALTAYDAAVTLNEYSLPEDISQGIRLAFHFMAPPILGNPLNRSISQLPTSQEDASEVLGILLPIYSNLLGQNYEPLTFTVTPSKTWEERPDLPLIDEIKENPAPPQKPEIKPLTQPEGLGKSIALPKVELTIEEIESPDEVAQATKRIVEEADAELAVINEQLRIVEQQRSELLKLSSGLRQYKTQMPKYVEACAKSKRELSEKEKIAAQIQKAEQVLLNPTPPLEELDFDVVDGTRITRSQPPETQHSWLVNFPADLPKGGSPKPLISLLERSLCEQVENGNTTRYIHDGHVRRYQNVSEEYQFDKFPPCLILHMNRFSDSVDLKTGINTPKKNTTILEVPLTLQLPEGAVNTPPLPEETPPAETPKYALESFVVHSGGTSPHGGHYIAYWKDRETGKWIEGNDRNVRIISEADALRHAGSAYMLFYRNTLILQKDATSEIHDVSRE